MTSTDFDAVFDRIDAASHSFKRRWTLASLRRVDEGLLRKFEEQLRLYDAAMLLHDRAEIEEQASAMCRGWAAITSRMESSGAAEDAYLEGFDGRTGTRVRISSQRETCDEEAIWITPDEVAVLLGSMNELKQLKQIFPGATVEEAGQPR